METKFNKFVNESYVMNEEDVYGRINAQGKWLHRKDGLGLNRIITSILYDKKYKMVTPLSDEEKDKFRLGISLLLKTSYGSNNIRKKLIDKISDFLNEEEKNFYSLSIDELTETFLMYAGLVKDENGNWCYVNKINTNYSALSDILVYIIKNMLNSENEEDSKLSRIVYKLIMMNDVKNALLRLKPRLRELVLEHIGTSRNDYLKFTSRIKKTSGEGNDSENQVSLFSEKNLDTTTPYQGGEGDFIDMIFGCDLIVLSKKNKYFTIQVKTYNVSGNDIADVDDPSFKHWVQDQCKNYSYRNVDLLAVIMNKGTGIVMFKIDNVKMYTLPNKVPMKEINKMLQIN